MTIHMQLLLLGFAMFVAGVICIAYPSYLCLKHNKDLPDKVELVSIIIGVLLSSFAVAPLSAGFVGLINN